MPTLHEPLFDEAVYVHDDVSTARRRLSAALREMTELTPEHREGVRKLDEALERAAVAADELMSATRD